MGGQIHLFGIRHHGPGSARSLVHALESLAPDCLLIEGPPEGTQLLPLAAHKNLVPPVALLIFPPEGTQKAVLYPFAKFSPEWQAIRFALARKRPVRFIDLPYFQRDPTAPIERSVPDPLNGMARAAGYTDTERWWDHLVESRSGKDLEVFTALHEMMTELRKELDPDASIGEQMREAHMRQCIRAAEKEGFRKIAVVCGAYHTPALANLSTVQEDAALLKDLPKTPMEAAWVPWSYERLSSANGYGAGIESPLWYELLWERRGDTLGPSWITRAARLLRDEDIPISSAHVIETCRLADTLCALRDRPVPGLLEYNDAAVSVLGNGDAQNLALIHKRWHFDNRLGQIPADEKFPLAPLQRNLEQEARRLRLKQELSPRLLELDLRETTDRARSVFLRRLRLLGVEWGELRKDRNSRGTFHEDWNLAWEPAMTITLIDSSRLGSTIEEAASMHLIETARTVSHLDKLVALLQDALLADLPVGLSALVTAIETESAISNDVPRLLACIPSLVDVQQYGNVRGTDASLVAKILDGMVPRMLISLPIAVSGIDDDAARALWQPIKHTHESLRKLPNSEHLSGWLDALKKLADRTTAHPLLVGCAASLRYHSQALDVPELARLMSIALSPGTESAAAASWVEGLLTGGATLLLHDERLRQVLDEWVRSITPERFVETLPLLRRAFSSAPKPERRALGELFTRGQTRTPAGVRGPTDMDAAAAAAVLPLLELIWSKETA